MITYQPKSKYQLPHSLYMQVLWKIKDYERLKRERADVLYGGGVPADGMPRGGEMGRPTEQKALRLVYISEQMEAVEGACAWIRREYFDRLPEEFDPLTAFENYGYFNCAYRRADASDLGASTRTWKYYRAKLCYKIAENLKMF